MKALKTGLASVALLAMTMVGTTYAADLGSYGGSLKDVPIMEAAAPVGGCYVRGDLGYGWNDSDAIESGSGLPYESSDIDDGITFGTGVGCARSNGLRYEMQYTFHGDNEWCGVPGGPDPICGDIETHSLMVNLYYDWDMGRRFKPYVGAGLGVAYHDLEAIDCTPAGPTCNPAALQEGGENVTFAWSVMTGVGVEVSDRMTLDVGYRYMDMGGVASGVADIFGFINPIQRVEDITSHEFKVGLRFAIH